MKPTLQLDAAGVTDVGQDRKHNEDSVTIDPASRLYAIADGMGGHMLGEVASQATLDELVSRLKLHAQGTQGYGKQEDYYNTVLEAVTACNELILEMNRDNGSDLGEGMGTTLSGAYFIRGREQVVIFNVGDSRLYRLRGRCLQQLTRDHTMYQEWYEAGQKGTAPSRNILVKAIGLLENISPDISLESVLEEDIFLICSDGLSNMIDPDSIEDYLVQNRDVQPRAMCNELISIANVNGGHDNISVVVIKVQGATVAAADEVVDECDQTLRRSRVDS